MEAVSKNRPGRIAAGFVVALMVASLVSVAAVSAQGNSSGQDCAGDSVTALTDVRLLVGVVETADVTLAAPLPAGTYELDAISGDAYEDRELTPAQPQEQWAVEFLAADGSVLAISQPTADLGDGVPSATWAGSIGTVTLADEATSVRIVHAAVNATSAESVRPSCFGVTAVLQGVPDDAPVQIQPADPADQESTITLDYDSTSSITSTAAVICDDSSDRDSGDEIDITLSGVDPGTDCIVAYPNNLDCTVVATPAETLTNIGNGQVTISFPADMALDVLVDVDCGDEEVVAPEVVAPVPEVATPTVPETTTTVPEVSGTTSDTTVTVEVDGITVTRDDAAAQMPTAQIAEAQVGNPAFTG